MKVIVQCQYEGNMTRLTKTAAWQDELQGRPYRHVSEIHVSCALSFREVPAQKANTTYMKSMRSTVPPPGRTLNARLAPRYRQMR